MILTRSVALPQSRNKTDIRQLAQTSTEKNRFPGHHYLRTSNTT